MQLTSDQMQALQILGFLYLRMGKNTRSRRIFEALMALDPGAVDVRLRLALACIRLRDGAGALQSLTGVVPDPSMPGGEGVYHLLCARAYALLGKTREARESITAFWQSRQQKIKKEEKTES